MLSLFYISNCFACRCGFCLIVFLWSFYVVLCYFFFSSRRRHTRCLSDWSSDVCSSDLAVRKLPEGLVLEGAGDCVWDARRNLFWMGYGPRSDAAAARAVEDMFGRDVVALELADPRFYHMDTALAPLPGGEVMYLPSAFTAEGAAAIRERVAPPARIEIASEDGCRLAANAAGLGKALIMSGCGRRLHAELNERGYGVVTTPLP